MRRALFTVLLVAVSGAHLSGCGVPRIPGITPYKPVIQQGNYLSQDVVAQVKPGMSREQVRFILGTPLITPIFHADRWDYVYWREDERGKREERRIALFFADGKLDRITGDAQSVPGSPAAGR